MENKRIIWKYIGMAAAFVAVILLCWYFRLILAYIALAVVLSFVGRPVKGILLKARIGRFSIPQWLATLLAIFVILGLVFGLGLLVSPLVMRIAQQLGGVNLDTISYPLLDFNRWCGRVFPHLGPDFKIEAVVLSQIKNLVNLGSVTSVVGSVSSVLVDVAIGVFSVVFMSYFFISDENIISRVLLEIAPEKYKAQVARSSSRTSHLLSRYFVGLLIESICIMLLNGLGLSLIAGMPTDIAIVVAAMTGILNVIPYIGPLSGELLAVMMGMVTHADCTFSGSFGFFLLVILLVCLTTQLIDNYVFQPVIYSNSVKAHPLEIFIVILMAAKLWGIVGLIIAIPGYTALRVILSEFFPDAKFVKVLTQKM